MGAVALLGIFTAWCFHNNQSKSQNNDQVKRLAEIKINHQVILSQKVENEINTIPKDWDVPSPQANDLLSRIERGDLQGIAIYRRLRPSADAGWAESLDYSMALALLRNPENILDVADTPERFDRFCTSPLIEPSAEAERAFLQAALKALRLVGKASPMAARRDVCVARLRAMLRS